MWLWLCALFLQLLGLAVLLVILLASYKFFFRPKPQTGVQKADWSRDVVYLYQFPLCPSVRTISPFALKLETWLRLADIPYKNVYTRKFSRVSHTIPYIELNGKHLADSNRIIQTLRTHFQSDVELELTEDQRAIAHIAMSMVENHTAQVRNPVWDAVISKLCTEEIGQ